MERKVRVRFAPSPTGPLHIGGVRTALFNYLFARRHGGKIILRIEDTDSNRFVPGAEEYINEAFAWLGIRFDEGVREGGNYGPYRQSERRDIYRKYVKQLLDAGKAYIAFDTPEELEAKRAEIPNFQYDASTRMSMRNSLTMPADETRRLVDNGEKYVVRFLIEPGRNVVVNDLVRGEVTINSSILDDKVLYKSADDLPTYHLANIVDDHLMEISHVIRGEEWLPSAPLHVLLYEAFGWTDTMPAFVHLPLLLKPDGKRQIKQTRRRPPRISRVPARMARPENRRNCIRLSRIGLFAGSRGQFPCAARLESGRRPRNIVDGRINQPFFLSSIAQKAEQNSTLRKENGSTTNIFKRSATSDWPKCSCPSLPKTAIRKPTLPTRPALLPS